MRECRFAHSVGEVRRPEFPAFLVVAFLTKPAIFYGFGLYRRYWRYATVRDLNAVVLATLAAAVVMSLFVGLALPFGLVQELSRAVLVLDTLLTLLVVGGIRMSVRLVHEPRVTTGTGRWSFRRNHAAVGAWSGKKEGEVFHKVLDSPSAQF